ncbi:MAG: response regulator [Candidatus Marinimicrobia bacterium]|nr:response regulator [Candidatus Neomarinimicrobiota bacterium]
MKKQKILIIDDEKSSRDSARRILRQENYDLYFAENGKIGLEVMEQEKPRLIILDVKMPVMNGIEVLKRLNHKNSDDFSVVVLSGHGTDDSVKACYDLGVTAFVHKPFTSYELKGLIQNTLDLLNYKQDLKTTVEKLNAQIKENKQLKSILPICSNCKRVHDEKTDHWDNFDLYLHKHTNSQVSHGLCPDCIKELYPDEYESLKAKGLL